MIIFSSVGIEALCQLSSHHSDDSSLHQLLMLCLHRAKMARPVRGHLTSRPQQEGAEEPERDPRQEEQPGAAEGKAIADYGQDVGYEVSEPKVEPDAQEQRQVDSDTEYAKMEMLRDGTPC